VAGRKTSGGTERNYYYPWGEERTATANEREKFGTYFRDGNGIDYADQRYYQSQYGRFMTADPYKASAGAASPGSWNRYAYVEGDPVNFHDQRGLDRLSVEFFLGGQLMCQSYTDVEGRQRVMHCAVMPPSSRLLPPDLREGKTDEERDMSWVRGHERENERLTARLLNRLATLPGDCTNAFQAAGISVAGLTNSAAGITFWNTTRRGEGGLLIGDVAGPNAVNASRPLFTQGMTGSGPAVASVIQAWQGNDAIATNQVVLHAAFYRQSDTQQDWTLVHEALHVHGATIGIHGDNSLARALGLSEGNSSNAIQTFLEGNCKR
jgi:RHS repeat-associated protein